MKKTLWISLTVMLLWGFLYPAVKLGYGIFAIQSLGDTLLFAGMRFAICGLVITAFAAVKMPRAFAALKTALLPVLLVGVFAIVLHYGLSYAGLRTTDGSKTAIIKQLAAVLYICLAGFIFPQERITWTKLGGLALGLAGIIAINTNITGFQFYLGDILVLASSFCTVTANIISKKAVQKAEPLLVAGISQLFGGSLLLIVGTVAGGNLGAVLPRTAPQYGIFGLIVAASVVSYSLWYMSVQKQPLSGLFIIKFSEPLFAAVFSWLLLGENIFRLQYAAAFLLISSGILLANKKGKTLTAGKK